MNTAIATVDAVQGEVVEGEIVQIDEALIPYVGEHQAKLEQMIRTYGSYAESAAVQLVISQETKAGAVKLSRSMKADRADVIKFFTPIKQSIDKVKKISLDMEKYVLGMIDGPVAVLTNRVVTYDREVAKEEAERRQRVIDAERKRLEAEAAERAAAEALRLIEEAEAAAQVAAFFGEATIEVDATAIGAAVLALCEPISDELVELAALEQSPAQAPEKVDGFYYVDDPKFVVEDLRKLVEAIAAGTVPLEAIAADESFIKKQVARMGADLGYPGVRAWMEKAPRTVKS